MRVGFLLVWFFGLLLLSIGGWAQGTSPACQGSRLQCSVDRLGYLDERYVQTAAHYQKCISEAKTEQESIKRSNPSCNFTSWYGGATNFLNFNCSGSSIDRFTAATRKGELCKRELDANQQRAIGLIETQFATVEAELRSATRQFGTQCMPKAIRQLFGKEKGLRNSSPTLAARYFETYSRWPLCEDIAAQRGFDSSILDLLRVTNPLVGICENSSVTDRVSRLMQISMEAINAQANDTWRRECAKGVESANVLCSVFQDTQNGRKALDAWMGMSRSIWGVATDIGALLTYLPKKYAVCMAGHAEAKQKGTNFSAFYDFMKIPADCRAQSSPCACSFQTEKALLNSFMADPQAFVSSLKGGVREAFDSKVAECRSARTEMSKCIGEATGFIMGAIALAGAGKAAQSLGATARAAESGSLTARAARVGEVAARTVQVVDDIEDAVMLAPVRVAAKPLAAVVSPILRTDAAQTVLSSVGDAVSASGTAIRRADDLLHTNIGASRVDIVTPTQQLDSLVSAGKTTATPLSSSAVPQYQNEYFNATVRTGPQGNILSLTSRNTEFRTPLEEAVQGNPLALQTLGIRHQGNRFEIPSADSINQSLAKLPPTRQPGFQFVAIDPAQQGSVSSVAFARMAAAGKIPLASNGRHAIQDASVHLLGAANMPRNLSQVYQQSFRRLTEALDAAPADSRRLIEHQITKLHEDWQELTLEISNAVATNKYTRLNHYMEIKSPQVRSIEAELQEIFPNGIPRSNPIRAAEVTPLRAQRLADHVQLRQGLRNGLPASGAPVDPVPLHTLTQANEGQLVRVTSPDGKVNFSGHYVGTFNNQVFFTLGSSKEGAEGIVRGFSLKNATSQGMIARPLTQREIRAARSAALAQEKLFLAKLVEPPPKPMTPPKSNLTVAPEMVTPPSWARPGGEAINLKSGTRVEIYDQVGVAPDGTPQYTLRKGNAYPMPFEGKVYVETPAGNFIYDSEHLAKIKFRELGPTPDETQVLPVADLQSPTGTDPPPPLKPSGTFSGDIDKTVELKYEEIKAQWESDPAPPPKSQTQTPIGTRKPAQISPSIERDGYIVPTYLIDHKKITTPISVHRAMTQGQLKPTELELRVAEEADLHVEEVVGLYRNLHPEIPLDGSVGAFKIGDEIVIDKNANLLGAYRSMVGQIEPGKITVDQVIELRRQAMETLLVPKKGQEPDLQSIPFRYKSGNQEVTGEIVPEVQERLRAYGRTVRSRGPDKSVVGYGQPTRGPPKALQEYVDRLNQMVVEGRSPEEIVSFAVQDLLVMHPFDGGNGRTARLLGQILQMKMTGEIVIFPKQFHFEMGHTQSELVQSLGRVAERNPGLLDARNAAEVGRALQGLTRSTPQVAAPHPNRLKDVPLTTFKFETRVLEPGQLPKNITSYYGDVYWGKPINSVQEAERQALMLFERGRGTRATNAHRDIDAHLASTRPNEAKAATGSASSGFQSTSASPSVARRFAVDPKKGQYGIIAVIDARDAEVVNVPELLRIVRPGDGFAGEMEIAFDGSIAANRFKHVIILGKDGQPIKVIVNPHYRPH